MQRSAKPGQPCPVRLPLVPVQRLRAGAAARPGTCGSGRSRRRGSPTTRRRRPRRGPLPARARPGGCRARRSRTRCRSRRSPSWRGTSGRRGRASRWRSDARGACCHRSSAIATSSSTAVSSSSSRVRSIRVAQHLEDLRLRPPVDEDDEAEAEPLLVLGVQPRELGQRLGVGVGALLGGRACGEAAARADRGVGVQRLELLVLGQRGDHLAGVAERVLARRRACGRARVSPSNSSASWACASAAAVDRARVGREQERDVVVAAGLDLDLGLDPREERRRRMEDEPVRCPARRRRARGPARRRRSRRSATSSSPRKSWTRTPAAGAPLSGVEDVEDRDHAVHLLSSGGRAGAVGAAGRTRTRRTRCRGRRRRRPWRVLRRGRR